MSHFLQANLLFVQRGPAAAVFSHRRVDAKSISLLLLPVFHPRTQHHKTLHSHTRFHGGCVCFFGVNRETESQINFSERHASSYALCEICEWKFSARVLCKILTLVVKDDEFRTWMSCGAALSLLGATLPQSVYKTLFGENDFPPPSYPLTRFQPTAGNLITPLNFWADYSAFLQLLLTKTFHFSARGPPSCTHKNSICLICYSNSLGCMQRIKKEKEKSFTHSKSWVKNMPCVLIQSSCKKSASPESERAAAAFSTALRASLSAAREDGFIKTSVFSFDSPRSLPGAGNAQQNCNCWYVNGAARTAGRLQLNYYPGQFDDRAHFPPLSA